MKDSTTSNKKIGVYLVSIFLLLLVIPAVLAEFSVSKGVDVAGVCPRDTQVITDAVSNMGDISDFTISIGGSGSAWSTTIPSGLILTKGESKSVYTYVTPKIGTKPGKYNLDVIITSNGVSKTLPHTVIVKDCYVSQIDTIISIQSACPKDIVKFEFNLNNVGDYQDIYNLNVEGQIKDWISLSESSVILNSKEKKTVYAYATVPQDTLGGYGFTVVAKSVSTGEVSSRDASINVEGCYDYNMEVGNNYYSICEHSQEIAPIIIQNKGTVPNTFQLSLSGPAWANLDKKELNIEKSAGSTSNLVLTPDYGVEGNFDVTVKVVPQKGILEGTSVFNIDVRKCHSLAIDVLKSEDAICNSASNVYDLIVKNSGEVDKNVKLELTAPEWVTLKELGPFSLKPGETRTVGLDVHPTIAQAGENNIVIKAVALDDSKVQAEDQIKIRIVSIEECYGPELKIENTNVDVSRDGSATVPITIENKGLGKGMYEIGLSGSASNFVQLNPGSVELDSGKSEVVYAYIAPSSEVSSGNYEAVISVRLTDSTILRSGIININVLGNYSSIAEQVVEQEKVGLWIRIKTFFTGLFKSNEAPVEELTNEEVTELLNETIVEEPVVETPEVVETPVAEEPVVEIPNQKRVTETDVEEDLNNIELNFVNIEEGKLSGIKDSVASFSLDGKTLHEIKVGEVADDKVTLIISSDPQAIDFVIGESKEVDVDGDGINDITVTLDSVSNGRANFDVKKIVISPVEEGGSFFGAVKDILLLYKYYIIAGIVILLIIILLLKTNAYKKVIEFFEEDDEVEDKKKDKKKKKSEEEEIEELLEDEY